MCSSLLDMSRHSALSAFLAVFLVLALQAPAYAPILCGIHGDGDMDHMPAQTQLVDGQGTMGDCHLMGGCAASNVGLVTVDADDGVVSVTNVGSQRIVDHDSQASSSPRPPPPKR